MFAVCAALAWQSKGVIMGDKGSKKNKDKGQKQQATKQKQKDTAKQAKDHPKRP